MYHGFSGYRIFWIFSFSSFDVVTSVGMDVLLKDRLSLDFSVSIFGLAQVLILILI